MLIMLDTSDDSQGWDVESKNSIPLFVQTRIIMCVYIYIYIYIDVYVYIDDYVPIHCQLTISIDIG